MNRKSETYTIIFQVRGYYIWIASYCKADSKSEAVQFMCQRQDRKKYALAMNRCRKATENDHAAIKKNNYPVHDATTMKESA